MATRQITALFTNNALKNCLINSPRYTTIAQGKGFVEKHVESNPFTEPKSRSGTTPQPQPVAEKIAKPKDPKPEGIAKEKAQEKNTGGMKHTRATEFPPGDTKNGQSPNPSTSNKKTLDEKLGNEQKDHKKHEKDPKASR